MQIDDLIKLLSVLNTQTATPTSSAAQIDGGGRKVIVRSRDAGVQYGELESYATDGSTVTLRNARQMWSWTAAQGGTLFDCATYGVKSGRFSGFSDRVIVIGACAIIDVMGDAERSLGDAKWS